MRSLPYILVVSVHFAILALSGHAGTIEAPQSQILTIADCQRLHSEAKIEFTNATATLKAAVDQASNAPPSEPIQQRLKDARASLEAIQLRLVVIKQLETALKEQGPIQALISQLKKQRDDLGNPTSEAGKSQRAEIEKQITAAERAEATFKAAIGSTPESGVGSLGRKDIAVVVILVLACLIGLGMLWFRTSDGAEDDGAARTRLAKAVTLGAMSFIVLVSVVTLLFAGINAANSPQDKERTVVFFDMAKWILGAVLPVVGAWVGGVLAYYFGKENFKAGAENAEKLVKQLSPQQKLESKKASEAGLDMSAAAVFAFGAGRLQDANLTDVENGFTKGGRKYERLPIVDANKHVVACLHLSTLHKYITKLSDADKKDAAKMTLGALCDSLKWVPDSSFSTLLPTDTLASAQTIMKGAKECSDVFVTADGKKTSPAQRWITDVDVLNVRAA